MIRKSELFVRICELEDLIDFYSEKFDKLEKKVKALEPKKERKGKKNEQRNKI